MTLNTANAIAPATPTSVLPSFTSQQDEILKAINDPFIGGHILEIAGLKEPHYVSWR